MNWTPEQLQKAERIHVLFDIAGSSDAEAEKDELFESLEKELGEKGLDRLLDHVEAKSKEEAPAQDLGQRETSDLLSFEIYDPKLGRTVPAAGYAIDQHCRPHGVGGQRRKRGPLSHQHGWVKRKGKKPYFFNGYWLTLNGRQRKVTDRSLALARFEAERKRRDAEPEI